MFGTPEVTADGWVRTQFSGSSTTDVALALGSGQKRPDPDDGAWRYAYHEDGHVQVRPDRSGMVTVWARTPDGRVHNVGSVRL